MDDLSESNQYQSMHTVSFGESGAAPVLSGFVKLPLQLLAFCPFLLQLTFQQMILLLLVLQLTCKLRDFHLQLFKP